MVEPLHLLVAQLMLTRGHCSVLLLLLLLKPLILTLLARSHQLVVIRLHRRQHPHLR